MVSFSEEKDGLFPGDGFRRPFCSRWRARAWSEGEGMVTGSPRYFQSDGRSQCIEPRQRRDKCGKKEQDGETKNREKGKRKAPGSDGESGTS